jgi:histone H3/H4
VISEVLPPDVSFSKETRDLLTECSVEFIHLVSSEANEICEKEGRKTIAAEHVTKALQELGFSEYISHINEIAVEHREQLKVKILTAIFFCDCSLSFEGQRSQKCQTGEFRDDAGRAVG